MGYCFLWFFSLTAAVLTVALGATVSVRLQKRWQAIAAVVASALPGLILGISGAVITGTLLARGVPHHWFGYSLSWLLVFVATSILLNLWAFGRTGDPAAPRAKSWPPSRIATGIGVAAMVLLAALWYMDIVARTELRQLHAEALARLLAVRPPRVPDHRNAAHTYAQAFDMMGDTLSWRKMTWYRNVEKPVPDSDTDEIREFLRDQSGALVLLRGASAMPDFYFETNYARGLATRVPRLLRWSGASRILILSARNRAARGDMLGALADVSAARRMAGHLASGSGSLPLSMARGISNEACIAYEHILSCGPLTSEALGGSPVRTPGDPFRAAFVRAWEVEAASFVLFMAGGDGLKLLYPVGRDEVPRERIETRLAEGLPTLWRVFFLRHEIKMFDDRMSRLGASVDLPCHEILKKEKKLSSEYWDTRRRSILASTGLLQVPHFGSSLAEGMARQGLADLALAATAYRVNNGRYPRDISELVPTYIEAIPVDPYSSSGERLRMAAVEDGAVLYSVGLNGKDDGGTSRFWQTFPDTEGDLTFYLGAAYEERRLKLVRAAAERRKARKAKQK